jgi:hypothetical protein
MDNRLFSHEDRGHDYRDEDGDEHECEKSSRG